MKNKIIFTLIICVFTLVATSTAQTNFSGNTLDDAPTTSSALGEENEISSEFSAAIGKRNTITGSYSTAFGLYNTVSTSYATAFGLHSEVTKPFSFAFGRYTKASGINSFVFGKGATTTHKLENSKNYSFLVGFKHDEPGFFISRNTAGPVVGIGTDNPQSRFDVRLGDKQEIRIQSEVPNTYGSLSFRHSDGTENWRIRAFSNFTGGYGNTLGISGADGGDFWVVNRTLIGDFFDFDGCTDCSQYNLFVKEGMRTKRVKIETNASDNADITFQSGTGDSDIVTRNTAGALEGVLRFSKDADGATMSFQDRTSGSVNELIKVSGAGILYSQEIIVQATPFPDYVFEENYDLMSLEEVENFVNTEKHLPGIPSAGEIETNGMAVGDMQVLQMEKIEELYLYLFEMKKELKQLQEENKTLKEKIKVTEAKKRS